MDSSQLTKLIGPKYANTFIISAGIVFSSIFALPCFGVDDETKGVIEVSATQNSEKKLKVHVSVAPKDGYKITTDNAPWMLKLNPAPGSTLKLSKKLWKAPEIAEKLPKFDVEVDKVSNDKSKPYPDYQLITFICTKDEKQCFREVYKGSTKPKDG